ncbi:hypothetical protein DT065_14050 [Salicibibacter kimchii]|uniref:Uncharacterized protein n=1 Tax=Salicibibacter kimchii TaxID=2099786 RepID=A0A345C1C8_9BACI|nr:hypothetical protein DT065_14050 [Salicibibacter kimchii]
MDAVRNAVLDNVAITIGPYYTVNNDFYVLNGDAVPTRSMNYSKRTQGWRSFDPRANTFQIIFVHLFQS